jgi:hypothetical protein
VTAGVRLPEVKRGKFDLLREFIEGQLSADPQWGELQFVQFCGWLKWGVECLQAGNRLPGQILFLAGPAGSGKSLLQGIITACLGGRVASPFRYLAGLTPFNADLCGCEHLAVEDEAAARDIASRENLGTSLKNMVVNHTTSLHGKGLTARTVERFCRVSFSLNDEPHALMVVPPLDGSMVDKVILLRTAIPGCLPKETVSMAAREKWRAELFGGIPGFLFWLLNTFEVPKGWRSGRYGVKAWQHPELAGALEDLHPATRLLGLIDGAMAAQRMEDWEGSVEDCERWLASFDGEVASRLFRSATSAGMLLSELSRREPERFERRRLQGRTRWRFMAKNAKAGTLPR